LDRRSREAWKQPSGRRELDREKKSSKNEGPFDKLRNRFGRVIFWKSDRIIFFLKEW
jgi:hypothetical protein